MFFQLVADAVSLTMTTRGGRSYNFVGGKPLRVDLRDVDELRGKSDLAECDEDGIEPRKATGLEPKSFTTFSGPSSEPPPKPAPHEPTPTELAEARKGLEGPE